MWTSDAEDSVIEDMDRPGPTVEYNTSDFPNCSVQQLRLFKDGDCPGLTVEYNTSNMAFFLSLH